MKAVLQVILRQSAAFPLILAESEARDIFRRWSTREFQARGIPSIGGTTVDGVLYSFEVAEVSAMLVQPIREEPQPPIRQPYPFNRSGN